MEINWQFTEVDDIDAEVLKVKPGTYILLDEEAVKTIRKTMYNCESK